MRCGSCGGILGRDCFNQEECEYISQQQEAAKAQDVHSRLEELERRLEALEAAMKQ